jgi:hypothetical protein
MSKIKGLPERCPVCGERFTDEEDMIKCDICECGVHIDCGFINSDTGQTICNSCLEDD